MLFFFSEDFPDKGEKSSTTRDRNKQAEDESGEPEDNIAPLRNLAYKEQVSLAFVKKRFLQLFLVELEAEDDCESPEEGRAFS